MYLVFFSPSMTSEVQFEEMLLHLGVYRVFVSVRKAARFATKAADALQTSAVASVDATPTACPKAQPPCLSQHPQSLTRARVLQSSTHRRLVVSWRFSS